MQERRVLLLVIGAGELGRQDFQAHGPCLAECLSKSHRGCHHYSSQSGIPRRTIHHLRLLSLIYERRTSVQLIAMYNAPRYFYAMVNHEQHSLDPRTFTRDPQAAHSTREHWSRCLVGNTVVIPNMESLAALNKYLVWVACSNKALVIQQLKTRLLLSAEFLTAGYTYCAAPSVPETSLSALVLQSERNKYALDRIHLQQHILQLNLSQCN